MDSKVTLAFDREVIEKAKEIAGKNGMSLSRFTEYLYRKLIAAGNYKSFEDLPVSDWVNSLAEGDPEYRKMNKGRKAMKDEFFGSRK